MLKILCVLLNVSILIKAYIAFSSEDIEDADVIEHYKIKESSLKLERVENYTDNVIVRNKVEEKAPSEPTSPQVLIEYENKLNEEGNIIVTFRWKKPQSTNGKILNYTVRYYWYRNQRKCLTYIHNVPSMRVKIPVINTDYHMMYFQVRAHNENGASPYTKFINVSPMHENPVPLLLMSSSSGIHILDTDLEIKFVLPGQFIREVIYSSLEHKIYYINEMWELISYDFNALEIKMNRNYKKIIDLDDSAHDLCIDWIARNLYWIQVSNNTSNIMKLDLTLWEQMDIAKYDSILEINKSQFLNILPFEGYFYWMELNSKNQYVIRQSDLDGKYVKPVLEDKNNKCFCPYKLREASSMQIDNTNIDKPIMYWTSKDCLIETEIYGCGCDLISKFDNHKFFKYLKIDETNIYLFIRIELSKFLIVVINKNFVHSVRKETIYMNTIVAPFNINSAIVTYGSFQPYPQKKCLLPRREDYRIKVINTTANSIVVNLPEPNPNDGCEKYHLATTIYNISVSHCLDNDLNEFTEFNELTHKLNHEIANLTPFTEYRIKLAMSNFYVDKMSFGENILQKTSPGKLNRPENVTVQVLTPTLAKIYWIQPKNLNCAQVNYEVHWIPVLFSTDMRNETYQNPQNKSKQLLNKFERTVDGKIFTTIGPLQPGQKYLIYVRVYPANFSNLSTDSIKIAYMYSKPNNLTLSGRSTNSMNISWIPRDNMINYTLEYKDVKMQEWKLADNIKISNDTVTHYIENLYPGTLYNFRLILRYREDMKDFIWPPDETFIFGTFDDTPSAPGRPQITRLPNSTYKTLEWKPAQVHDSQVISYYLEGLIVEKNYKDETQTNNWKLYYYGADNHWLITEGMNQKYLFRVRAKNIYGFGIWSETSAVVDLTESVEILPAHYYYLPVVLCLIVILVVYNVYYFYRSYRQHRGVNNQLPVRTTDIELATLNEMSLEHIQHNMLYDSKLLHELDKLNLKIIESEHITFEKSLGSGEFGEVFQGTVKNLEVSGTMPVAIKMVVKNASPQDKEKFLQEGKLMGRFSHKHVLTLLSICLNTNSPMLILELMEGGDLLKYLTESRKELKSSDPNSLRLQDLLAMCEDVARGCCYLEELRILHRDLACRNCLISSRNRETRIVKIGDFGLARDICKKDYYCMKGEHRLPFRWMAPESLKDGIFTFQSDVWAFGVLMWEITSLGEHPYSDKNNGIEVLGYLRAGGRLLEPLNCPSKLYGLMQHCWSAVKNRPKFLRCLENIVNLRGNIEDPILVSPDIIEYTELPSSGELENFLEYQNV